MIEQTPAQKRSEIVKNEVERLKREDPALPYDKAWKKAWATANRQVPKKTENHLVHELAAKHVDDAALAAYKAAFLELQGSLGLGKEDVEAEMEKHPAFAGLMKHVKAAAPEQS